MPSSPTLTLALLQLFTLWGAILLFSMEPLVGRLLLPGYGGSYQVWTTCLMFFQAMLLVGYGYTRWIGPRIGAWHLALVLLPLPWLPLGIGSTPPSADPMGGVLWSLGVHVALPFGVLATTGVMAHTWLARSKLAERRDPYFLYAASNVGSLLGLFGYPFLMEPLLGLRGQAGIWTAGYLGYAALALALALRLRAAVGSRAAESVAGGSEAAPSAMRKGSWLLLAAAPAILLMAVTNAIALQVGSLPMFWVLPLGLYLLTFVLAFGRRSWLARPYRVVAGSCIAALALAWSPAWRELAGYLLLVFWLSLLCHSELHARRPAPSHLTRFYWIQSLGGFLGGAFVAVLAPQLFPALYELGIGILLCVGTLLATRGAWLRRRLFRTPGLRLLRNLESRPVRLVATCGAAAAVALGCAAGVSTLVSLSRVDGLFAHRNFYGIYAVRDVEPRALGLATGDAEAGVRVRALVHGKTLHGFERLAPGGERIATGYYHRASPYGEVFSVLPSPKRVAVVGLGTGAMAAHFEADDELVYYEIDPDNEWIARDHFGFLEGCPARTRVVVGDGRLQLAQDAESPDASYDALMLDAFSGDGVPTHLMTREAIEGYLAKVRDDGLLVFHISNRYYDLRPVLKAASGALGLVGRFRDSRQRTLEAYESPSIVYVLARRPEALEPLAALGWSDPATAGIAPARLWTDDYVNPLVPLLAKLSDPQ